jgi:hypothetical protein
MRRWFLNWFAFLLRRKWKIKSWLASLKPLTNLKNPSGDPLQELVAAFRNPPVTEKLAPYPGCDFENCSVNLCAFRTTFPLHVGKVLI